jgi:FGGY-family pentulose kinase
MEFLKPFLIGIDAGTGSVRVGIFDTLGHPVTFSVKEYKTDFPRPGWAEQDPDEWWSSLKDAVKDAVFKCGINVDDIAAIAVDGTSSTVVCLGDDRRVLRKAILWMDNRSSKQAQKIFQSGDDVLKRTQAGVSAEWFIPKALWIKENEESIYEETRYFMEQVDWINYKLTGDLSLSINHITHRWFYNERTGGWPEDLYSSIDLHDFTAKVPKRVLKLGEIIGVLSASAARELGLKKGIVVAEGGCDAYLGMLGLNVVKPGRAALIAGSSHVLLPITDKDIYIKGIFGVHPECVIPGLNVMEGGQVSSGSIVNWFKNNFTKNEELEAQRKGLGHYEVLNHLASQVPLGSEGIVVLDFWQGNRNPYTDYMVQGAIWGLTLKHKTAHLFRGIMEGVAYGTENILRTLSENGVEMNAVYICGGTTKSDVWLQIHADVSNIPFIIPEFTEATIMGSAICAAKGAGVHTSLEEASNAMVRVARTVEPETKNHEKYEFYFDKYRKTYFALRELMYEMSSHEAMHER